jgi:ABC-2 type transport system permease protein
MKPLGVVRAITRRIKWEQLSYWRNPAAAGFTFAFPLMFLFIFTTINGNDHVRIAGTIVRFAQFFVPGIVAFGLISACYTNLAIALVFRRQTGILKRTRGTPVSPTVYLAGLVGSSVVVALILSGVTIAFGIIVYGVIFPGRYLGLVVAIAAGAFCFSALGVAVASLVPNEDAAPAIINFLIFPLLFLSGTFGNVRDGSGPARVSDLFPIRHLNKLMFAVFNPAGHGTGVVARDLLAILAWSGVALVVGIRRFRWEPRLGR